MGWVYCPYCMSYTCRGAPRIVLSRDASAWVFLQIWHLASQSGNLPVLGDISRWRPLSFYNLWQAARISWHTAKGTSPDPLRSWMDQNLAAVTKSCWKKLFFCTFLTLTFDLWPWFTKIWHVVINVQPPTKNHVDRSIGCSRRGDFRWTHTQNHRPLL